MMLDIGHFNKLDTIMAAVIAAGGQDVSIAGGAVRDSVLEKPIADIDVFYSGDLDEAFLKETFGEKETPKSNPPRPNALDYNTWDSYVTACDKWEAECTFKDEDGIPYEGTFSVDNYKGDVFSLDGMKVQLIKVELVDDHISKFPCFLSRMTYSEGCLVIPKEAIQDVSLGIIRFTDDCPEKYKAKLEKKYEEYL